METQLTNEDVDFLTELVAQEVEKGLHRLAEEVKGLLVALLMRQFEVLGYTFNENPPPENDGQVSPNGHG